MTLDPVWTERVVAAYVLLVLRRARIIDVSAARAAAALLGVTANDARLAAARPTDPPRLAETFRQPATSPAGPVPAGRPRKPGRGWENRRDGVDGPERRCTKCRCWFPATPDHFSYKDRTRRTLRSWCRTCWNDYQRERYLTRAASEALDGAGIRFVLDTDQPHLACSKCGRPLVAGDEVDGRTELSHVACGTLTDAGDPAPPPGPPAGGGPGTRPPGPLPLP